MGNPFPLQTQTSQKSTVETTFVSEVLRVSWFPHIHTWLLNFAGLWAPELAIAFIWDKGKASHLCWGGGSCLLSLARELIRQEGREYVREMSELTEDRIQFTENNSKGEVHAAHSKAVWGPLQWSSD